VILVYDGTFEGFLSLVHEVYYKKYVPHAITKKEPHANLLDEVVTIEYDEAKAVKVFRALQKEFPKEAQKTIMHIFLCDTNPFELDLLEYIKLGFKNQKELQNINNPHVFTIINLQKELFRHYHKYSGFLRFEELEDGTLYAKIDSKFSLTYLLGAHFVKRFNNQNFIIHDVKRALAFAKYAEEAQVRSVADFELPSLSDEEEKFKKLWQTFFKSVAIETRKNERLQKQLVPLVYRTYMSEFIETKVFKVLLFVHWIYC